MTNSAPAGWHVDPHHAGQMRYWDGQAWTEHVAPAGAPSPQGYASAGQPPPVHPEPRRRMHPGAVVGIVVGAIAALLVIIAILAAIAIPVFLNQREKAADAGAKSDARVLATEIHYYYNDYGELPEVTWDGVDLVVRDSMGEYSRFVPSTSVELSEYVTDGDSFCVALVARQGSDGGVHYSDLIGDVRDGPCP